jgi:hypothetical protein
MAAKIQECPDEQSVGANMAADIAHPLATVRHCPDDVSLPNFSLKKSFCLNFAADN